MIATKNRIPHYGPGAAGIFLTPRQFDRAILERGNRYELIQEVLVVAPSSLENERDPNDELGRRLRNYQEDHPNGALLDATLPEHTVRTGENRRVVDRALWVGLERLPIRIDFPTVTVEFVSEGKRNALRDYETKRDEYMAAGAQEYWIFDRFERTMTVYQRQGQRERKRVFREKSVYVADLLPGFELPLETIFKLAERWPGEQG